MDEVELKTTKEYVKLKADDDFVVVTKSKVEIPFYIPVIKETVIYEFNLGEINYCGNEDQYVDLKDICDDDMCQRISQKDIRDDDGTVQNEIATFKPYFRLSLDFDIDECDNIYFFNRVWNENKTKELPLFYGVLYTNAIVNNEKNLKKWIDYIHQKLIAPYTYSGQISSGYFNDWRDVQYYMAEIIFEVMDKYTNPKKYEEIDENFDRDDEIIASLSSLMFDTKVFLDEKSVTEKIDGLQDNALKTYMQQVLDSLFEFFKNQKIVSRCENCGDLFKYKKSKKYCSESCLKSSANKRQYQKRVQKPTEK